MTTLSRRGLFGLICGFAGTAMKGTRSRAHPSDPQPESPPPREVLRRYPMDDEAEVFETVARLHWYDHHGRYGFLREQGSDRRILIHVTCLKAAGFNRIEADTLYRCEVLRRPAGYQAFRIFRA